MLKSTQSYRVTIILSVSLATRWYLIFQGGQYYFSDEQRYETSRAFAKLLLAGNFSEAFSHLFTAPEHLGFKIIGIIPAFIEQLTRESLVLPALFFSLFSVLNLYLIYQISKRTGASGKESFTALVFAASSMSLLYYARHLIPYDTAMTFGLLAIYTATSNQVTYKTSLLCGATAFLCFITYNGYWSLAALVMLFHALRQSKNFADLARKGLLTAAGFILPAILLIAISAVTGTNLLNEYRVFATTVSQGAFDEGWSLPFEYFWHTEHIVFIILGALSIYAIAHATRKKERAPILWAGAITFLYLCLVIPSVFLHSFVVYGRLARQMMPFLILLSASGLERLEQNFSFGKKLARIILAAIAIQAAWNYQASYALTYPREFAQQAQSLHPEFVFSEKRLTFGAPTLCQNNGYIIEYVKHFGIPPESNPPILGEILLSAQHPDNFLPYQYEGYTYEERQYLRELKPEMRFYKADVEFMSDSNPLWKTMKSCVVKEN